MRTKGRKPKSYGQVGSCHDGKGCVYVFVCGLCWGRAYGDTYVFMYMNMQNMFELSLQAPRKFIAAVGEKCFWLLRLISVRERQARGLSNAGLPPVGLDCKGWLTFALRFIRSICELTFEIIDELCISYNSLVFLGREALGIQHRLDSCRNAFQQLLHAAVANDFAIECNLFR